MILIHIETLNKQGFYIFSSNGVIASKRKTLMWIGRNSFSI